MASPAAVGPTHERHASVIRLPGMGVDHKNHLSLPGTRCRDRLWPRTRTKAGKGRGGGLGNPQAAEVGLSHWFARGISGRGTRRSAVLLGSRPSRCRAKARLEETWQAWEKAGEGT